MQSNDESFVLYPLSKIQPIIPEITRFLTLKRQNWGQNWQNAVNNNDIDSMSSLISIIKIWKMSEWFYDVPQPQQKFQGKLSFVELIVHLITVLKKEDHFSNKKIAMILANIFRFFFVMFDEIKDFVKCWQFFNDIIFFSSRYVTLHKGINNKKGKQLDTISEIRGVKEVLINILSFLQRFDKITNKTISQSLKQQIFRTINEIAVKGYIDILMETFLYIKMDFLLFVEKFNINQIEEYWSKRIQRQHQKQKQNQRQRQKHSINLKADEIFKLVKVQNSEKLDMKPIEVQKPIAFLNNLKIDFKKSAQSNRVLIFSYLRPLLHYLPYFLLRCTSYEQKRFLFSKIFLVVFDRLSSLCKDNIFKGVNQSKVIGAIYIIRGFRNTTILNDMEAVLAAFQEEQIIQNKQANKYSAEYQQILNYFKNLIDIKETIIKKTQQIAQYLKYQWPGPGIEDEQSNNCKVDRSSKDKGQQNSRGQPKKSTNNLRQDDGKGSIASPNANSTLTINNVQKPQKKKRKSKPKSNKNSNKGQKLMSEIKQQSDEDEENSCSLNKKSMKKRQSKSRKSNKPVNYHQNSEDEETAQEISMQPMNQIRSKKSGSPQHPKSEFYQKSNDSNQNNKKSLSSKPVFIFKSIYLSNYFQNHSHPWASLSIFKEVRVNYEGLPWSGFHEAQITQYCSIINSYIFENEKFQFIQHKKPIIQQVKGSTFPQVSEELTSMKAKVVECYSNYYKLLPIKNKSSYSKQPRVQQAKQKYNKAKNQSHKLYIGNFYVNTTDHQSINLYPLSSTQIGKQTHISLVRCLQQFFYHLISRPQNAQLHVRNPFNKKKICRQQIIRLRISNLFWSEIKDFLMVILFQIMSIIKSSENFNQLQFFKNHLFKRLQKLMQSMLLFYMLEIEKQNHYGFNQCINIFMFQYLSSSEMTALLSFLIKGCKINKPEMNQLYLNLYQVLVNKCYKMADYVSQTLCEGVVYSINKLDMNGKQAGRKNRNQLFLQGIESKKKEFYQGFSDLIEMLNLLLILTEAIQYSPLQPDQQIQSSRKLLFYCPTCTKLFFIHFSLYQEYNYQTCFCSNCRYSVLNRFQLSDFQIEFETKIQKTKILIKSKLNQVIGKVTKCFQSRQWRVNHLPYHKYEEGSADTKIQIESSNEFAQNIPRRIRIPDSSFKSTTKPQNPNQANSNRSESHDNPRSALNQSARSNRSNNNARNASNQRRNHNSHDRRQNQMQSQVDKSPQEEILYNHEEFGFNNCRLFIAMMQYFLDSVSVEM